MITFGSQLSFGVFFKVIANEFGFSRALVSGIISASLIIYGISSLLTGRLTDKWGAFPVVLSGLVCGSLGYLLITTARSFLELYIYYGLGIGLCVASSYAPISATISKVFPEKKEKMLSFAFLGIPFGQLFLPPFLATLIEKFGWRMTSFGLSVLLWLFSLPILFQLWKYRKLHFRIKEKRTGKFDLIFLRNPSLWMLLITGLVISAGFHFLSIHIVPYATDLGMPLSLAALTLSFSNLGSLLGTFSAWYLVKQFGHKKALIIFMCLDLIGISLLPFFKNPWSIFPLMFIFGFGFGGTSPIRTAMVPQIFGIQNVGTILGYLSLFWAIGGISGPILAGYVFDITKSYNIAFLSGGFLVVIGIAALTLLYGHSNKP